MASFLLENEADNFENRMVCNIKWQGFLKKKLLKVYWDHRSIFAQILFRNFKKTTKNMFLKEQIHFFEFHDMQLVTKINDWVPYLRIAGYCMALHGNVLHGIANQNNRIYWRGWDRIGWNCLLFSVIRF